MNTCKDTCPLKVKNVFLGCNGRPEKYKKECPRLKEFEKQLKRIVKGNKNHKGAGIKSNEKLGKFDFLVINRGMNGNWNGGDCQFTGPTKKITKGEELKLARKLQKTTKRRSRQGR